MQRLSATTTPVNPDSRVANAFDAITTVHQIPMQKIEPFGAILALLIILSIEVLMILGCVGREFNSWCLIGASSHRTDP